MKRFEFAAVATCFTIAFLCVLGWAVAPKSDDYIRDRVVKLVSSQGSCTGEQVHSPKGRDYVLTAGHCRPLAEDGQHIIAITEKGKSYTLRIIKEDPKADLLLLSGIPGLKGLEIASYANMRDDIWTFTHGHGMDTYKTQGVLVQYKSIEIPTAIIDSQEAADRCLSMPKNEIAMLDPITFACVYSGMEVATTAYILPGSSGGPAVNFEGNLVAVASATGDGFFWFVPLPSIQRFMKRF